MTFRTLNGADLKGKTALVRVDFNVPMEEGKVTDDTRLRAALPTIELLAKAGAKIALLAHFDRPKGKRVPEMSLKPLVDDLSALGATCRPVHAVVTLEKEVDIAAELHGDPSKPSDIEALLPKQ
jgi:phosphoglycerate kinase